ncbi:MAG TPA: ElyC/SanA/YdcF family protein [Flavobacteriales bacterium]
MFLRRLMPWCVLALDAGIVLVLLVLAVQIRVHAVSHEHLFSVDQVQPRYTGIVLGCRVREGDVSACLEERLIRALELYQASKVQRLLLSGDHGRRGYDEVNAMKDWFVARDVPAEHLFLDHAGFDTYDTMRRARDIFQVRDAVVVSQAFHLPRAVYLARSMGIDAVGSSADPPGGSACRGSAVREPLACLKAWSSVTLSVPPHHGGEVIPITGSSRPTFDRPVE